MKIVNFILSVIMFGFLSILIAPVTYATPSINYVTSISDDGSLLLNGARSVKIDGNFAYVISDVDKGLSIFNISDPSNPTLVGQLQDTTNFTNARFLEVSGNYVFVVGVNTRLVAVDISNKSAPSVVGTLSTAIWDIKIKGNFAYISGNDSFCFKVVDISTPSSMSVVSTASATDKCSGTVGIEAVDNYAYTYSTSGSDEYLTIFDITSPTSPSLVGSWSALSNGHGDANCQDLILKGDYLYCTAYFQDTILAFNVTTKSSPTLVDYVQDSTNMDAGLYIETYKNYLVAASYFSKALNLVSISNPNDISISVTKQDTTYLNNPYDIALSGSYIYVPVYTGDKLSIYNIVLDDEIAPVISGESVTVTDTSATVVWNTVEPSSTQINYGTTMSLGTSTNETDFITRLENHTVTLTGLTS